MTRRAESEVRRRHGVRSRQADHDGGSSAPSADLAPRGAPRLRVDLDQRVYKLSTGTAAVVAEGGVKPDAGVVTSAVDLALLKLAAVFSVSDELAEDAPFLIASIQRQVIIAVLAAENAAIVSALSAASGALTGTGTKALAIDVLAAAIGNAETLNGITPAAVLMSPADIAVVRAAPGARTRVPAEAGYTSLYFSSVCRLGAEVTPRTPHGWGRTAGSPGFLAATSSAPGTGR